ncbi:MAG: flagellar basal body L-ring protein FlgH [Campylobacterota bacterium]|nr:flagellar basal body L-ring protein FlgH [Campylobacterota bacterium]
MSTALFVILLFSGCTAKLTEPEIAFTPPEYVEQMPARDHEQDFVSTGSIFGKGDNPLFSDHKAMNVNDIVTVVITENASSSNNAKKSLAETDTGALGGGIFSTAGDNGAVNSWVGKANGLTDIGFNTNSTSSYSGQGSSSKDASFSTTVSARVVKVMQNGNYFISGRREILIDDEKQIIQISGVIRPYDIDQNNQIYSAQISDAKILYSSEGDIERATKQGWGTKLVHAVWPF